MDRTKMLIGATISGLVALNLSLMQDLNKRRTYESYYLDTLNRYHKIATLYVIKKDFVNEVQIMKEEFPMLSNLSPRTKILAGATLVTGIGTMISVVMDKKAATAVEAPAAIPEITEVASDVVEAVTDAVDDVADEI